MHMSFSGWTDHFAAYTYRLIHINFHILYVTMYQTLSLPQSRSSPLLTLQAHIDLLFSLSFFSLFNTYRE